MWLKAGLNITPLSHLRWNATACSLFKCIMLVHKFEKDTATLLNATQAVSYVQ